MPVVAHIGWETRRRAGWPGRCRGESLSPQVERIRAMPHGIASALIVASLISAAVLALAIQ